LVLTAFAVVYGCGQASSPVERQEKQGGAEEAKPKEPKEEQAPVKCEDFASREAAQEYLDTHATASDSQAMDPDDNGRACDEGAYLIASEPASPANLFSASASVASGFFIIPVFSLSEGQGRKKPRRIVGWRTTSRTRSRVWRRAEPSLTRCEK
jgi:hypothetical protein